MNLSTNHRPWSNPHRKTMNLHSARWVRGFFIALCLSLCAAMPLHAISPHAGTYYGSYKFYDGTTATGVPYTISQIEFTIEENGTITNVVGGVTNTLGTIQGTVTDGGAATYTIVGANLVSGTIASGVFTGTAVNPPPLPGHPSTTQTLLATRVYGVLPAWTEATSAAGLYPAPVFPTDSYTLSVAASDTTFVAFLPRTSSSNTWSTLTSTDGVAWTKHSLDPLPGVDSSASATPISYANDRFFFALGGTTLRIYSSVDGVSWSLADTGIPNLYVTKWYYNNGSYVALAGRSGTTALRVLTSPDAVTWTLRTLAATGIDSDPTTLANDGSKSIIGLNGRSGSTAPNLYSGTNFSGAWTSSFFPHDYTDFGPQALFYGNGFFLGSGSKVLLSTDGVTWNSASPGPPISPDDVNFYAPISGGLFSTGNFYGTSNIRAGELLRTVNGHAWFRAVRAPASPAMSYGPSNVAISHGIAVSTAYISGLNSPKLVHATLEYGPGLTVTRPPFVTSEPADQSKLAGTSFSLVSSFKNNGLPTTYQWFKDGQPLAGKTGTQLFIPTPVVGDAGSYTCVATNAAGSTSTRAAAVVITLPPAPTFNSYPASQNVPEGNNGTTFSLAVSANGSALSYQWRLADVNLPGKTTATLTLTSVPASSGAYDCVVMNAGGVATHPPALITFLPATAPYASASPLFLTSAPTAAVTLSAGVSGGLAPYSYQWYQDDVLFPNGTGVTGATTASLVLNPAQAGSFRCQVTASTGVILGPPSVVSLVTAPAPNLLGKPFVKIADQNTFRPDSPAVKLGTLTTIRFREDTALIVDQAASSDLYLYRWKDGALSAIATNTLNGPNGLPFVGIDPAVPPTEPSSGSFFFVGYHTVATVKTATLYRWFNGALTAILSQNDASPDASGVVKSFSSMAAHDDVLFFTVFQTLPDTTTERRIYRRGTDGVITLIIGPTTPLPGTASAFSFPSGQFSYDGTSLLMPLYDKASVGALFRRTNDGTLTRLYDTNTPIPLASANYSPLGSGDVEGGRIFAGSANNFEASFNSDGSFLSASTVNARLVTACGPDSYLSYLSSTGPRVYFRQNALAIPVIVSGQTVDGFVPTSLIAEAHGTEAAIRATNGANTSVLLALDKPAEAIPLITYQPASRTLDSGATATFTALASGEALSWQWLKDDAPIPGATYNTLTVANLTAADVADYKAVVTNSLGSATSGPATLALLDTGSHAPVFILQPADQQFAVGQRITVGYTADPGASAASYLWTKNGLAFSTAPTLAFPTATAANAGIYQLTITNAFDSASSRFVTVSAFSPFLTALVNAGLPANQRGPLDDPDGDGIPNLLEYALGLAPALPSAGGLPAAVLLNGNLTFTYTRARADVTYQVLTSTDLAGWTLTGVTQGTPDANGVTTATIPLGAFPGRYLQLHATLNP